MAEAASDTSSRASSGGEGFFGPGESGVGDRHPKSVNPAQIAMMLHTMLCFMSITID
jgi:hypothetical protein